MRGTLARAVFVSALAWSLPAIAVGCPDRPPCEGCGCKGGTGYRGPDGRCVGFRRLDEICGVPPGPRCVFENAPGTGANRDCALAPRRVPSRPDPAPVPSSGV